MSDSWLTFQAQVCNWIQGHARRRSRDDCEKLGLATKGIESLMATAGVTPFPPQQLSSFGGNCGKCADASTGTEMKRSGGEQLDSVLARSLKNENDLLRFQLNDIIAREKHQRIELQRLRSHRDVEVSQMVSSATTQLNSEVDQLKGLLQSTSAQLLQALTEKEKIVSEKDQATQALEEVRHDGAINENNLRTRAQHLEDVVSKSFNMTTALADSIDSFQRHVLPTFNPANVDGQHSKPANDPGGTKSLTNEVNCLP